MQLTDSAYVAVSMRIMTRMGQGALDVLGDDGEFVPCVHSVGAPLEPRRSRTCRGRATPTTSTSSTSPRPARSWSYGSGYGGNALLGKKCFALRIASVMARDDGWLAEHMLILKLTNPQQESKYIAAAFPSACGKTNLAMLVPTIPGWTAETVGDDICWMKFGDDGRLYAINPEAGFFGVAPGTGLGHQRQRDGDAVGQLHLHQHRADRRRRRVVGGHDRRPAGPGHRLEGQPVEPGGRHPGRPPERPLHGAGVAVPVDRPGVGGPRRRADLGDPVRRPPRAPPCPLVTEAYDWEHGVFLGSIMASETTAAQQGAVGKLRFDPMAMLPFCGYNFADYFAHWLSIGKSTDTDKLPRIFFVNWFRRDEDGRFLWPGFGENSRVLKWVFERVNGDAEAVETPIGLLPTPGGARHRRPGDRRRRPRRRCSRSTPPAGGRPSRRSASTTPSSARTSRPR